MSMEDNCKLRYLNICIILRYPFAVLFFPKLIPHQLSMSIYSVVCQSS